MIDAALSKVCNLCKSEKTTANFSAHPLTKDRLQSQCKACAKTTAAAYYLSNMGKLKAKMASWYLNNTEKANQTAWRKSNPEALRANRLNRRARECSAIGRLSKGLAAKLFKLQRGKCACCARPLGSKYHLDHVMPLALGGSNTDRNIQLLRPRCNQQKNAKHPVDFMQQRGFLI